MKSKYFLTYSVIIGLVLMSTSVYYPQESFQQETPSYFLQIDRTAGNCPVTHLFANQMHIPVTVKLFHDQTPTFAVIPRSLTNSTTSLVTMDANDKNAFLVTTNSTDQFDYHAIGSYTDGVEHPIFAEYWSQNVLVGRDQFSTDKGYWCRDFLVDTSIAPPVPDYNKMIQDAQAGAFQGLISSVLQEHTSIDNMTIAQLVATGINIFVLIIFLIFHRSSDSTSKKISNKVKLAIEKLNENIGELNMMSQHLVLHEKQIADKEKRRDDNSNRMIQSFNTYARNWQDQFVIAFRSMMLDTGMIKQEKLEAFEKLTTMEPIKIEEVKPVEQVVDVSEIEKEVPPTQPVVVEEKKTSRFSKFLKRDKKKDVVVKTEEEWRQFFIEKKLTKEQVLKLYNNMTSYVQKNYRSDISAYNKYNALFHLYQELDQK